MNEESVNVTDVQKIGSGVTDLISLESDDHYEINGGILSDTRLSWVSCGPRLTVVDNSDGSKRTGWTFSGLQRDAKTKVTCVTELPQKHRSCSLLIVGCENSVTGGTVCIYHTGTSRLLKAIHMTEKVTALDVIHPGDNTISPLPDLLQLMSGVVAVGTRTGTVYFLDLCHNIVTKCIESLRYPINDELKPSQLVEVDLNDVPTVIEAKRAKCISFGHTLSVLLNDDAVSDSKMFLLCDRSGRVTGKFSKDEVYVSALQYFPQICSLGIGFNISSFQLWNLIDFTLIYTSVLLEAKLPVSGFSFLEPCDDPRNVCYLWAFHQSSGLQQSVPFAAMYMLNYDKKDFVQDYGNFYQGFSMCSLRYELDLGDDIPKAVDGRIIACRAISKTLPKTLPYLVDDQECNSEESAISLLTVAWEVWASDRTSVTTRLSVFDLNQWYKEQMPMAPSSDSSASAYLVHLDLFENNEEAVIDVRIRPDTLKQFSCLHQLDEHFYPSSLSFDCICLLSKSVIHCSQIGIQRACLAAIENGGPSALLNPERLFRQCISAGLRPLFFDAYDFSNFSSKEQRDFVLSVVLENGMNGFLWDCVREWADGSQAVAGSTLPSLLYWAWSRVTLYKHTADSLCVPLFDFSGIKLDTNDRHILHHCIYQLHKLSKMLRLVLDKYRKFLLQGKLEQQCIALGLLSSYMDAILWFVNAGLLPERSEDVRLQDNMHIPCYLSKITSASVTRRAELHHIAASLKHPPPSSGLYLIDAIISEEGGGSRLTDQWEREGGNTTLGMYPPPSLQSLIRIYLLSEVSMFIKHYIVVYFLMDLTNMLDSNRYDEAIEIIERYGAGFGLTDSQTRVIKGFWNLDHKHFTEGLDFILEDCVKDEDIRDYQHRAILCLLLSEGKYKLALRYINMKKPPLSEMNDISLQMTLLLVSNLIHEAFQFQRQHASYQTELLEQFFAGCVEMNRLDIVFKLPMNAVEEEAFMMFLEKSHLPSADELRVLYLLTRSRYIEAISTNDKLNALSCFRKRGGNAPLGLTPFSSRGRNILGGQEDLSSGSPRKNSLTTLGLVINSISKTIPSVTKELAEHCVKQKASLSSWKQVERPKPLSVLVHTEMNSDHLPNYKASSTVLMDAALSKTRETWASLLATPAVIRTKVKSSVEEMPFLRTPTSAIRNTGLKKHIASPLYESRQATESYQTIPSKRARLYNDDEISLDGDFPETARKESSSVDDSPLLRTPYVAKKVQQKRPSISSISSTPQSILKDRKRHGTPLSISATPSKKMEKKTAERELGTAVSTRQIRFSMPSTSSPEVSSSEIAASPVVTPRKPLHNEGSTSTDEVCVSERKRKLTPMVSSMARRSLSEIAASPVVTPRKPLHNEGSTSTDEVRVSERKRKLTPMVSSMARRSLRSELNRLSQEPSLPDTAEEQADSDRTSTVAAGVKRKLSSEDDDQDSSSSLERDKNDKHGGWWKTHETVRQTEYFRSNESYKEVGSEKTVTTVTEEKNKYDIISGRRSYVSEQTSASRTSLAKLHSILGKNKILNFPDKLQVPNRVVYEEGEDEKEEEEEEEEEEEVGGDKTLEEGKEERDAQLEEENEEEVEEEEDVEEEEEEEVKVNYVDDADAADADLIKRGNYLYEAGEKNLEEKREEVKQTVNTDSLLKRMGGEKEAKELQQKQIIDTVSLLNKTVDKEAENTNLRSSGHKISISILNTAKKHERIEQTEDLYKNDEHSKEIQIIDVASLQENVTEAREEELESTENDDKECEVLEYSFGFVQSVKQNKETQFQNFVKEITIQSEEDAEEQSEDATHGSIFIGVKETEDSEFADEHEVIHTTSIIEGDEVEVNDEFGGSVVEYADENDIIYADLQPASIYDAENSDERKEILYGPDEQLEDNEDVQYYDGDLDYGDEEREIVEEEEEDEEEVEEEEEDYNEEEIEEEEEEGLEEREAGEAETEDLDDEDNQNRSESSDVICLDSDSEETNQYSSTRDNVSVSDVQKEQVHKVCHGKVRPSESVLYTNMDLNETLDYDEEAVDEEVEDEQVSFQEEDDIEIEPDRHEINNVDEIEKSVEGNEDDLSEAEITNIGSEEELKSDTESPQQRNRSWQFEKNTVNITVEELKDVKESEDIEISDQKISNVTEFSKDSMKHSSLISDTEAQEAVEGKEGKTTLDESKTGVKVDMSNIIHKEEKSPVNETEKEGILSSQEQIQNEEEVTQRKAKFEDTSGNVSGVNTVKPQSDIGITEITFQEVGQGKITDNMNLIKDGSVEYHVAHSKYLTNECAVTSSVDPTRAVEPYGKEIESTDNNIEQKTCEHKKMSIQESAKKPADSVVICNKNDFEVVSEASDTKEPLLVKQSNKSTDNNEDNKRKESVSTLKGDLLSLEDEEKQIDSEKVTIEPDEEKNQKSEPVVNEKNLDTNKIISEMDGVGVGNEEVKLQIVENAETDIKENFQTVKVDGDASIHKDQESLSKNEFRIDHSEINDIESSVERDRYGRQEHQMHYDDEMGRKEQKYEDMDVDKNAGKMNESFNKEDSIENTEMEIDEKGQQVTDVDLGVNKEKEKISGVYCQDSEVKKIEDEPVIINRNACVEMFQDTDKEEEKLPESGKSYTNALGISNVKIRSGFEKQIEKMKQDKTEDIKEIKKNRKTMRRSGSVSNVSLGSAERKFRRRSSSVASTDHKLITSEGEINNKLSDVNALSNKLQNVQSTVELESKVGSNLSEVDVNCSKTVLETDLETNKVNRKDRAHLQITSESRKSVKKTAQRRRSSSVDIKESAEAKVYSEKGYKKNDDVQIIEIDEKVSKDAYEDVEINKLDGKEEKVTTECLDRKATKVEVEDKLLIKRHVLIEETKVIDEEVEKPVTRKDHERDDINAISNMQTVSGVENQSHKTIQFETGSIMDLKKNRKTLRRSGSTSDVNVASSERKLRRRSSSLADESILHGENRFTDHKTVCSESEDNNNVSVVVDSGHSCNAQSEIDLQHIQTKRGLEVGEKGEINLEVPSGSVQSTVELESKVGSNLSEVDVNCSKTVLETDLETNKVNRKDRAHLQITSESRKSVKKTAQRRRSSSVDIKESAEAKVYSEKGYKKNDDVQIIEIDEKVSKDAYEDVEINKLDGKEEKVTTECLDRKATKVEVEDKLLIKRHVLIEETKVIDEEVEKPVTRKDHERDDINAISNMQTVSGVENQSHKTIQFETGSIMDLKKNRKTLRRSGSTSDVNVASSERKLRRRSSSLADESILHGENRFTDHKTICSESEDNNNVSVVVDSGHSCNAQSEIDLQHIQTKRGLEVGEKGEINLEVPSGSVQSTVELESKVGSNLSEVDVNCSKTVLETDLETNKVNRKDRAHLQITSESRKSVKKTAQRRRSSSVDIKESAEAKVYSEKGYKKNDDVQIIEIDEKVSKDAYEDVEINKLDGKEEKVTTECLDRKATKVEVEDKLLIKRHVLIEETKVIDEEVEKPVTRKDHERDDINAISNMQTVSGVENQSHKTIQFETGSIMDLKKNRKTLRRSGSTSDVNVASSERKLRRRSSSLADESILHGENRFTDHKTICSESEDNNNVSVVVDSGHSCNAQSEIDLQHIQTKRGLEAAEKGEINLEVPSGSSKSERKTSFRRRSASVDYKNSIESEVCTEKVVQKGSLNRKKSASSDDLTMKSGTAAGDYSITSSWKTISTSLIPASARSDSESSTFSQLSTDNTQTKVKSRRSSRARTSLLQHYHQTRRSKRHSRSIDLQPLEVVSSDEEQMQVVEEVSNEDVTSKIVQESEEVEDSDVSKNKICSIASDADNNVKTLNETVDFELQSDKDVPDSTQSKTDVNQSEINLTQSFDVGSGGSEHTDEKGDKTRSDEVPVIHDNSLDTSIASRLRNRSSRASSEPRHLSKESNSRSRRASSEEIELESNRSKGRRKTAFMRKSLLSYYLPSTSRQRRLRSDYQPLEVIESDEEDEIPGEGKKTKVVEDKLTEKDHELTKLEMNEEKPDSKEEKIAVEKDVTEMSKSEVGNESNRTLTELEEIDTLANKPINKKKSKRKKDSEKLVEIYSDKLMETDEKQCKKDRKHVKSLELSNKEKKDLDNLEADKSTSEKNEGIKNVGESVQLEEKLEKTPENFEVNSESDITVTSKKGQRTKSKARRKLELEENETEMEPTEKPSRSEAKNEEKQGVISSVEEKVGSTEMDESLEFGSEKSWKREKPMKGTKKGKKTLSKKGVDSNKINSEIEAVTESARESILEVDSKMSDITGSVGRITVPQAFETKQEMFDSPAFHTRRCASVTSDTGSTDSKGGRPDLFTRGSEAGDRSDDNASTISGSSVSTRRRTFLLFDTPARRTRQSLSRTSDAESVDSKASTTKSETDIPEHRRRRRSLLQYSSTSTTTQPDSSMIDEYTTNRRLTRHQLSLLSRSVDVTPDVSPMEKVLGSSRLEDVSEESNVNEEDDNESLKTTDSVASSVKSQSHHSLKTRIKSATSRKIQ